MKYFKHILGFVLIAFGIIGVIRSRLGASPIDAFNYFLYIVLTEAGIAVTLGTVVFLVGSLATLLTYILTKDKTLVFSFLFLLVLSIVVDGWNALFGLLPLAVLNHLAFRIPIAVISFFVMCYGVALTLHTKLPTLPYERLLLHIDKNINNISISKIFIDGTFFVLAVILGLLIHRLFEQVFIMTFVIAFFTGVFVKWFLKLINQKSIKGVVTDET